MDHDAFRATFHAVVDSCKNKIDNIRSLIGLNVVEDIGYDLCVIILFNLDNRVEYFDLSFYGVALDQRRVCKQFVWAVAFDDGRTVSHHE